MSSNGASRQVHLVGSIPAPDTEGALRLVLDHVGDRVIDWLPDGETGDRGNWIGRLVENLKHHPDLDLIRDGDWSDYEATPAFKVKDGHTFEDVDLDYYAAFEKSWPEFQKARADLGRPDIAFQVGIPGPIDIAFAAFGFNPVKGFRHARPFEDATVLEVRRIHEAAGNEVVYQLEIPIEVEVTTRIPGFARRPGTRWLARRILRLVERSPLDTRWGFHLCVGDMNNQAFSRLETARPVVQLANALASQFPVGRHLEFIHLPLAHGEIPPTTEEAFYVPLGDLNLRPGVRLIAGLVHEQQSLDEQRAIRDLVEQQVGSTVDVAASCGLGRRASDQAALNLDLSRLLVD